MVNDLFLIWLHSEKLKKKKKKKFTQAAVVSVGPVIINLVRYLNAFFS